MTPGVFGKLPARRDYVQYRVEPALMALFDPWLQGAVTESRAELGDTWLDMYLTAPIWRFWLGPKLAGKTATGALMPSVDGVGRYFPLCLIATSDGPLPPPEIEEQAAWFSAVDELLLGALADDGSYEGLLAGLDTLPLPVMAPPPADGAHSVAEACAALRIARAADVYGHLSFWWVTGAAERGQPPRVLMRNGLPSPAEYAMMMTTDFREDVSPTSGGA